MTRDIKAEILYNSRVSGRYFRLGLKTGWSRFNPGQFVMVRVPDDVVFLRRPFSISRAVEDDGIELLYKIVGPGTERLSRLEVGEKIDVIGPQGRGYRCRPRRSAKQTYAVCLVAGGFGIAPFVGLVDILARKEVKTTLYYGGRGMEDILFIDEFEAKGVKCRISTEDGSLGHKGIITELLEGALDSSSTSSPQNDIREIFCCGPTGLTEAVIKLAKNYSIPAQVSFETYMGCGIGVCLGCAVRTKGGYKQACKDGPVFSAEELDGG